MQILGLVLLVVVLSFGFTERAMNQISAFDLHALIMVLGGSTAAIMISSTARAAFGTLLCIRELIPFAGTLQRGTDRIERQRKEFATLWRGGQRAQAVQLAEQSTDAPIKEMLRLVLARASEKAVDSAFLEIRHDILGRWQPATTNWELLARLGPSFGLVGTVTGMVQLFRNMADDNLNIGAAMSMALISTLYGIAFGAGMAGPIGHYLRGLLDERLGAIARCRQSVVELAESSSVLERI
ncbi:MAG: MotA/TolQ/ExbB proton channel family protein [Bradymonadia bacterium]